ncbi:GlxA family transcriptional regulator [Roseibium sp. RKSG952]|uniref:GlxA family transcriptional regulator n=1 Tax=Roseibium sp. RKSG952 TaxID=2529384 RepID=UPI0012BBDE86|nr:helix-turn-helix domain-containing protein [Roseibium sp. RKSG952]MTI02256.1 helix-turn-helix domain-containing protein [Roseibium sp. RKSG952]
MKKVSFVLFPEFQMLAYVLATETLRIANKCAGRSEIVWQTRTATNTPVQASNGAMIAPDKLDWSGAPDADLVVLCAGYSPLDYLTSRVRAYIARAAAEARVLGGLDTGAIILAELGLLNGSQAVLHHEAEAVFREHWPEIIIADKIFCLDKQRLTAAGGTATGDAMLAWIARDIDQELAEATANGMIHGGPRSSETPQRHIRTADPALLQMHQLMVDNISDPLTVQDICTKLGLSQKQLRRRCCAAYQMTPSEYYRRRRLEAAHQLLVNSQLPVTQIALSCGFETISSFSRAMHQHFGSPPKQIRKRYLGSG